MLLKTAVRYFEVILIAALVVVAVLRYYVFEQSQSLAQMQDSGVMRVLISDEPDSQYVFNKQRYGFEYEMLARFAESKGLALELEIVPYAELFSMLDSGVGDIAVGGILDSEYVSRVSQPTDIWYEAQTTIVYRRGEKRPLNLEQLADAEVLASARYFDIDVFDELNVQDDHRSEYRLLAEVANGSERFALSTNYRATNAKHYLPELNRSFILPQKVGIVWALPKRHDPLLLQALNEFLQQSVADGLPQSMAETHLAFPTRLSTYDALSVHRKIKDTLPKYEFEFRRAARRGGIDWQLLAAVSYQESRWSNSARSPTGVRGIMQLTQQTAKSLGVNDRMDMSESIEAAAIYLGRLRARLPERIKEPERSWFAVGAYNVGYRHVLNAYRKARELGLDRTKWQTISDLLPELYGKPFSKGVQAKHYVERVQIFTDILRFYDLHQREELNLKKNRSITKISSTDDNSAASDAQ